MSFDVDAIKDRVRLDSVVLDYGIELNRRSGGRQLGLCPFHDDHNPSMAVFDDGHFFCFACKAGGDVFKFVERIEGVEFKEAARILDERTGVGASSTRHRPRKPHTKKKRRKRYSPDDARRLCGLALARTRDDEAVDEDRDVYAFLEGRGIAEAWEMRSYGILTPKMNPPWPIKPKDGYRLLLEVFNWCGQLASVQARLVRKPRNEKEPKTLNPPGPLPRGAVLANGPGRRMLAGEDMPRAVVVVEGITDFLATSTALPTVPVLAIPTSSNTSDVIGEWVRGMNVTLAVDTDKAGSEAAEILATDAYQMGAAVVRRVEWDGEDAADFCLRRDLEALADLLLEESRT